MNDLHTNIIKVSGKNIANFFQNIITNDIFKLTSQNALYSSILTPQGKYLIDFFIIKDKENYILECNNNQTENLIKEFKKYDIRNDITFSLSNELESCLILNKNLNEYFKKKLLNNKLINDKEFIFFEDPRSKGFLVRVWAKERILLEKKIISSTQSEIDLERIKRTIPNSEKDMEQNKSFILNYNFEKLNALSFKKGCFIGQENTARQKYRGTQKYILKTIKSLNGSFPKINEDIFLENEKIGTMKTSFSNYGLCIIRNEKRILDLEKVESDKKFSFQFV
jgi:tRNA-modifying protein YgfZ